MGYELVDMFQAIPETVQVIYPLTHEARIAVRLIGKEKHPDETSSSVEDGWDETEDKSELITLQQFSRQCIDLLNHNPEGEIFISNFVPKYHQYFGWECKLSSYGFTKLVKLLAAIPDTVTVVEDENHEKVVRLTNSAKLSNINEAHLKVDAVDVDVKDENDAKTEPEAAHINDMDQSNATSYQKRERAIQIVNPNTGKEVKV